MLENYLEVVRLTFLLQGQDRISNVDIEEGLVDDTLVEISGGFTVVEEALLSLVVPRHDQLVS